MKRTSHQPRTQGWWKAARDEATKGPSSVRPRKPGRRMRHTLHAAPVDGVAALRIAVPPRGGVRAGPSWALDPAAATEWKRVTSASIPLHLQWWREAEGRTVLRFDLPVGARCLGLGERYGGLNRRGRVHTLMTLDDPNHTESTDSMYKSIPFLLVREGESTVGIFVDSPAPQRWILAPEEHAEGRIELLTRRGWEVYVLGPAPLADVVAAYTRLTGRQALPPRWSLGHQQSRWSYPTEQRVLEIAREFRDRKIPCDAIVLDIDYMEEYRAFTVSEERFPHFERTVSRLGRDGFRVVTIVDPGVKRDIKDRLYLEGRRRGAFCVRPDGRPFVGPVWAGPCCFPDFINDEVRKWWQDELGFLLSRGIAGIWNDMNEPSIFDHQRPLAPDAHQLPPDREQPFLHRIAHPGSTKALAGHLELRNVYGQAMARASWDAQRGRDPELRPFVLTRSCYAGMQRYGAVWLGDNKSWFEHLRQSIPMLLSVGLSGIPFCGVDVGGFGENCDGELLTRWYQLGIFYPFFRNHCAMENRAQEPWAFGEAVESNIRHLIEARYRLLPYIEQLFAEHLDKGAPLMRPLEWHAGNDPIAAEIEDQFFFGRDVLVAPILYRGHSRRAVYLPKGLWHPFEGGPPLRGGRYHSVAWGGGQVPAFVRDGAILPLAAVVQHTADSPAADITFRGYGRSAKGLYREDDGLTFGYERGVFTLWHLELSARRFHAAIRHRGLTHADPRAPGARRRYFVECEGKRRRVRLP